MILVAKGQRDDAGLRRADAGGPRDGAPRAGRGRRRGACAGLAPSFSHGEKVAAEQPDEGLRLEVAQATRTPHPSLRDTLSLGRGRRRSPIFTDTASHLRALFAAGRPIVGICAAGILIRILAPLLSDKRDEPPVLAVSEDGASIVPLLGGHRGANDLARALAAALGGHAAITTAGDSRFGVALDAPPPGWTLANPERRQSR